MPFNGVGIFSPNYSWQTDQANGILVRADRMDTQDLDIASGLSNCITRDGQGVPSTDISWATNKIINLKNGTLPQDATTVLQVFTSPTFNTSLTLSSGTADFTAATEVKLPTPVNPADGANLAYLTANYAPLVSPPLTGIPTAPTAAFGTSTTQLATTAFCATLAFSSAMPAQLGNANKFITTDGTTATWQQVLVINDPTYWMGV
jgi:hypothetical protein